LKKYGRKGRILQVIGEGKKGRILQVISEGKKGSE
jgi:hypothetical protein